MDVIMGLPRACRGRDSEYGKDVPMAFLQPTTSKSPMAPWNRGSGPGGYYSRWRNRQADWQSPQRGL